MSLRFNYNNICLECRSDDAILVEDFRNGKLVCRKCGLINQSRLIDPTSEWRSFSDSGSVDESRVGVASPLTEMLSTTFEAAGRMRGLQRLHARGTLSSGERTVLRADRELVRLCQHMGITEVTRSRALEIVRILQRDSSLRGKSLDGIAAACLYVACREDGVPRTFKEFVGFANVTKRELGRAYKFVVDEAKLVVKHAIRPELIVERYVNSLRLPIKVAARAMHICRIVTSKGFTIGKQPTTIVGAAIFKAVEDLNVSCLVDEIASAVGMSADTIKGMYRDICTLQETSILE